MKRLLIATSCLALLAAFVASHWHRDTIEVRMITLAGRGLPDMRIALMSDFHFATDDDLAKVGVIKRQLIEHRPDLILMAGDYTGSHRMLQTTPPAQIVSALAALAGNIPTFAVLGNHDNGRNRSRWMQAFEQSSIHFVEHKVLQQTISEHVVCIRGLGDFHSDQWRYIEIPENCADRTLTLTHDPYGLLAGSDVVETLSFAGHTHCGQIVTPWGWRPVIHSHAPKDMHCGVFENGAGGVVSGGIGTSSLPIRFGPGAAPGWELIDLR